MNVDLSGRGLTSFQEVVELIGDDNLSKITYLYLNGNQITSFEHFPMLPKLWHLSLWNNQIASFEHFPILLKLWHLYLNNN
jgi:Leucine-rich repeat (LRR) protein